MVMGWGKNMFGPTFSPSPRIISLLCIYLIITKVEVVHYKNIGAIVYGRIRTLGYGECLDVL